MTRTILLTALALLTPALAAGVNVLKQPKAVGYRAERCSYQSREQRVSCSGNVVVTREDVRISCQRLEAELDGAGRIVKLECHDQVEIVTQSRVARSDQARYDARSDELTLDGNARVAQGQSRLAGQVIVLDLETGDLQVQGKVRGVLGPEVVGGKK
jgi:lipopolysaccharide export system protein LptA